MLLIRSVLLFFCMAPASIRNMQVIKTWIENVSYPALHGKPLSIHDLTQIWSWIVGIFPLGGMFGGLACGWFADRFGR